MGKEVLIWVYLAKLCLVGEGGRVGRCAPARAKPHARTRSRTEQFDVIKYINRIVLILWTDSLIENFRVGLIFEEKDFQYRNLRMIFKTFYRLNEDISLRNLQSSAKLQIQHKNRKLSFLH